MDPGLEEEDIPPNLKGDTHCIGGIFVDGQGGANTVEMALARPRERGSQQVRCGDKGGRAGENEEERSRYERTIGRRTGTEGRRRRTGTGQDEGDCHEPQPAGVV